MKRVGHLIEKVADYDNLYNAARNASIGKQNKLMEGYFANEQNNILLLLRFVYGETPLPTHEYRTQIIKDSRKERQIVMEDFFPWKILYHAIIQVLEPIFRPSLIDTTCSCIKGRGVQYANARLKSLIQKNPLFNWFWKIDYKKHYLAIPHDTVTKVLRTKIKDERLIQLLLDIIFSYKSSEQIDATLKQEHEKRCKYFPNTMTQKNSEIDLSIDRGLAIGAYTSLMISN